MWRLAVGGEEAFEACGGWRWAAREPLKHAAVEYLSYRRIGVWGHVTHHEVGDPAIHTYVWAIHTCA